MISQEVLEAAFKVVAVDGFYVFNGVTNFDDVNIESVKQEIRRQRFLDVIFNQGEMMESSGFEDCGDQKRKQILFKEGKWSSQLRVLTSRIRDVMKGIVPNRTANDHVFLLSEDGCSNQRAHCDWDPELGQSISDDGVFDGYPMGGLLALEDSTYLNVWPGSITFDHTRQYNHMRIVLNSGDLLLFRADLIHSGSSFENSNLRVHCFYDKHNLKRDDNKTYYMDELPNVSPISNGNKKIKLDV